jgi:hypothetical protein
VLNYDLVMKVAESKRPYVSNLIEGALIRRLFTAVYVPAFKDGVVINVAIFPMDTSEISKILVRQPVPTGWLLGVIDGNGRFIARSRDEAIQLGSLASEGWRAAAKNEPEGIFESISMEGVPLFSAHKQTEAADWSVSIGAPQRSAHVRFSRVCPDYFRACSASDVRISSRCHHCNQGDSSAYEVASRRC